MLNCEFSNNEEWTKAERLPFQFDALLIEMNQFLKLKLLLFGNKCAYVAWERGVTTANNSTFASNDVEEYMGMSEWEWAESHY